MGWEISYVIGGKREYINQLKAILLFVSLPSAIPAKSRTLTLTHACSISPPQSPTRCHLMPICPLLHQSSLLILGEGDVGFGTTGIDLRAGGRIAFCEG